MRGQWFVKGCQQFNDRSEYLAGQRTALVEEMSSRWSIVASAVCN
jgi:hypothetical protein